MSILIVGSEGAQGKRYQAICKFLKEDYYCQDLNRFTINEDRIKDVIDGIIIATPTDTHEEMITKYMKYRKPLLVEKPLMKNLRTLQDTLLQTAQHNVQVSMVYQYRHLSHSSANKPSHYNYFRHGNDTLHWDCLQIIGLARGDVTLKEDSPWWDCEINGQRLNLSHMDMAYVDEVRQWMNGMGFHSIGQLIEVHQKVKAYERGNS